MKTKTEILNTIEPRSIKLIGVKNSWGNIGNPDDYGTQWLGEDYFTTGHIWSAWTHVLKSTIAKLSFDTDMTLYDSSDEIKRLQAFLSQLGYFTVEPTGYYGNFTRSAIYKFQLDHVKLTPWEYFWQRGSKVGPKTRTALNLLISN